LLVAASFVHLESSALDQGCSMGPSCIPAGQLALGFGVGGALSLLSGVLVLALSFRRGIARSRWLTLPP
jgi:hypothetical protein